MLLASVVLAACLLQLTRGASRHRTISWGFDVSHASTAVYQGDTITWSLDQGDGYPHTVTSTNVTSGGVPVFDSGSLFSQSSFVLTVTFAPGSYAYYCQYYPYTMQAVLTVLPGSAPAIPVCPVDSCSQVKNVSSTVIASRQLSVTFNPVTSGTSPIYTVYATLLSGSDVSVVTNGTSVVLVDLIPEAVYNITVTVANTITARNIASDVVYVAMPPTAFWVDASGGNWTDASSWADQSTPCNNDHILLATTAPASPFNISLASVQEVQSITFADGVGLLLFDGAEIDFISVEQAGVEELASPCGAYTTTTTTTCSCAYTYHLSAFFTRDFCSNHDNNNPTHVHKHHDHNDVNMFVERPHSNSILFNGVLFSNVNVHFHHNIDINIDIHNDNFNFNINHHLHHHDHIHNDHIHVYY